jgi:hypothetical protein
MITAQEAFTKTYNNNDIGKFLIAIEEEITEAIFRNVFECSVTYKLPFDSTSAICDIISSTLKSHGYAVSHCFATGGQGMKFEISWNNPSPSNWKNPLL